MYNENLTNTCQELNNYRHVVRALQYAGNTAHVYMIQNHKGRINYHLRTTEKA
jgi:hypothetical protein